MARFWLWGVWEECRSRRVKGDNIARRLENTASASACGSGAPVTRSQRSDGTWAILNHYLHFTLYLWPTDASMHSPSHALSKPLCSSRYWTSD